MTEHETDTKEKPTHHAAKGTAKEKTSVSDDAMTFEVADLIVRAPEYLGVPQYIAAGGLYNSASPTTIEEAQAAIETWLGSPVAESGKA